MNRISNRRHDSYRRKQREKSSVSNRSLKQFTHRRFLSAVASISGLKQKPELNEARGIVTVHPKRPLHRPHRQQGRFIRRQSEEHGCLKAVQHERGKDSAAFISAFLCCAFSVRKPV